jgi:hypothetical protein
MTKGDIFDRFGAAVGANVSPFTFAFGAIVAMFVIFVAAKGELGTYIGFFTFAAPAGTPPAISPQTINPGPLGGVQGPFGTWGGPGNFPGF